MDKNLLHQKIENRKQDFFAINDRIWEVPELRFREIQSFRIQTDEMERLGFTVEKGVAGLATAFTASWGNGKPVIAILGEYDALANLSQVADLPQKSPVAEGAPGHGCGHNTLGTAAMAAAAAARDYLEEQKQSGTIRYYGCPAEESGAGKAFLVEAGCFDDVDVCLAWHPDAVDSVGFGALASLKSIVEFHGTSAHAAACPELGRSALDAAELMNVGVNFLREHVPESVRMHYAFTNAGGEMPNVVQSEATLLYAVRARTMSEMLAVYDRIVKIANGAAMMTETQVTLHPLCAYADIIQNRTLTDVLEQCMRETGPMQLDDSESAYARAFTATLPQQAQEKLTRRARSHGCELTPVAAYIEDMRGGSLPVSNDVGNVSWVVPTAMFTAACYAQGTPGHSWQLAAQGKSSIAHKGLARAAEILAMAAIRCVEDPGLVEQAKRDWDMDMDGKIYNGMLSPDSKERLS